MPRRFFSALLCACLFFYANPAFAAEAAEENESGDKAFAAEPEPDSKSKEAPLEDVISAGFQKIKDSLELDFKNQPSRTTAGVSEIHDIQWPKAEGDKAPVITIFQSTSQILRFDRALARVSVSDTSVCDITTLGTQEVLIYCTKPGRINLLAWDVNYQVALYDIQSVIGYQNLQEILSGIDPEAQLTIIPYGDSLAVHGSASTTEKVKKIEEAIKAYNAKAISYVRVVRPKQILLEVRFAEIDRRATAEKGLDGEYISRFIHSRSFTGEAHSGSTAGGATFKPTDGPFTYSVLDGPGPSIANAFLKYSQNKYTIAGFLRWLESKNILKLTARPNLLAMDGEEASFVVGGETPYAISTQNTIQITFKEFGTKLTFTPTVLDSNQIRLKMNVQVSELDFSNTVSIQGTTVPTIVKTTHQTVAELNDNETMVVGGLINQRINKVDKKIPLLGDIRGLDRLFKRQKFERKDVEILIVVTPRLVQPFPNPMKAKELYPPTEVMEATSLYVPAYPDLHGDMINRVLVQEERYHDFDGFAVKRAKEVEDEFARIKKRETQMEKTLRKLTGINWKEEIDPLPPPPEPEPVSESELFTDGSLEDALPDESDILETAVPDDVPDPASAAVPARPVS